MRKTLHLSLGKGLRTYLWLTLSLASAPILAQQCPSIINCQLGSPNFCDESANDQYLWNDAPFTYSPTIGDNDLHEGPIDLNIKLKGCNGGGLSSISYTLYLDLDNDEVLETVLRSNDPPPAGKVQANNSFNPNFSGGDTVQFDRRLLPDSMLYRFTLELVNSGDTTTGWVRFNTAAEPFNYVPVLLPEGRHRIEWVGVQDGVPRYCDRNFRVRDCKKPTLNCAPVVSVYLDATQMVSLHLSQVLQSVTDNITPDSQLLVGIRRLGSGMGFPNNAQGNPQDTVMFNCQNTENQFIELWAKDKAGNIQNCTASVLVYDTVGFCPFTTLPSICAHNYADDGLIRNVAFSLGWSTPNQPINKSQLEVSTFGCSELSAMPSANIFTLRASKDTLPRNGLTTFDLVLISKHILAVEPFDEGWKLTAADANRSNSVTTFDIVEFRKLILGLVDKLPNGTPSWRFFVDTCTVWGSPFFGNCPTEYTLPLQAISSFPPYLSFHGVKIGDVNGTASNTDTLQGLAESRSDIASLTLPDQQIQAGQTLEIPLRATEGGEWTGLQFSLNFDPEIIEIEDVVSNGALNLETANWAKPQPGVLNLSWSEALHTAVLPGDALLSLRVKAHSTRRISEVFSLSKEKNIQPEAYDVAGVSHVIKLNFSQKPSDSAIGNAQVFAPIPNPTTGSARLPLRLNEPEIVSLEISDLAGKVLWHNASALEPGAHFLEIPAAALPQSGVYVWRAFAGSVVQSGRLVRL